MGLFGRSIWLERARTALRVNFRETQPMTTKPNGVAEESRRQLEIAKNIAVEAELPALLDRRRELVEAAIAEHAADVAAYAFECRRHGDFLTVFTTRLDRRSEPARFSTSINLLRVTEIRLVAGSAPATERDVRWHFQYKQDGRTYTTLPLHLPGEGEVLKAYPAVQGASTGRKAYLEAESDQTFIGAAHYGYDDNFRRGSMPTPALDDEVHILGVGSALLTPFGRGKVVLDAILAEMAATPTLVPS